MFKKIRLLKRAILNNDSKIFAIIPARAGSKSIERKNLKIFNGKELYKWSIDHAIGSKSISAIVITTDSEEIISNERNNKNIDFLIKRPADISGDDSPASEYIDHVLSNIPSHEYDYFCILQPTSPLRKSKDIDDLVRCMKDKNLKNGVTVVKLDHNFNPRSLMTVSGGVGTSLNDEDEKVLLRQKKSNFYARNGAAVYIANIEDFRKSKKILSENMAVLEMEKFRSIDIDTDEDFRIAEALIKLQ